MFSITDLIRSTADVLNYVQKNGSSVVSGRGRPSFTIVETEEYEALLRKIDNLKVEIELSKANK